MRILQVHNRYRQRGGEDTALDNERDLLLASGHDVLQHLEQNPHTAAGAAVGMAASPWNPSAIGRVLDSVSSFKPDVVHVHNTWFSLSSGIFPTIRGAGYPVVATMHNYRLSCLNAMLYRQGAPCEDCVGTAPWRGVVRGCYRGSVTESGVMAVGLMIHRFRGTWEHDVDAVIALTDFATERLVAGGVPADRITVKPNTVPDPGERRLPVDDSSTVLFVGRLAEEKGVVDLLTAWRMARRSDLELLVVGAGPLAASLRPPPGVTMAGPVPSEEIPDLMSGARAILVPSRWYEGQPMVILEALASGLPVGIPDLGALPEITGDGGLTFEPGDVSALARLIERLSDSELVARLGQSSRSEYELRYSPPVGLAQLETVYRTAMERRASAPQ